MVIPILVFLIAFYVTWINLYAPGEFLITLFNSTFVGIVAVAFSMPGPSGNCAP